MVLEILTHTLVFNTIVLAASMYILLKAADLIILGTTNYARKLGLSNAIIGLIVVSAASSTPDIISSLTGFMTGNEAVGLGAIMGSTLIHAVLAIGLIAIVGKKVKIKPTLFTRKRIFMWTALTLPLILSIDGQITRLDGIIMLALFATYLYLLWREEGTIGKIKKNIKLKHIWRDAAIFLGCLAALILAGRYLVFSSIQIANYFSIPPYFIALTIIGTGTTMPDLAIELKAVLKRQATLGLGNLIGSLMISLPLYLGTLAVFKPIPIETTQTWNATLWLALAITLIMIVLKKKTLTWKHGIVLLGMFAAFMIIEIIKIA